jgi:hypothetical protein
MPNHPDLLVGLPVGAQKKGMERLLPLTASIPWRRWMRKKKCSEALF